MSNFGMSVLNTTRHRSSASNYGYYNTITVNSGQVPSTQSNFPMLFYGTFSQLKTVANGGDVTNSSGYDIIFSSTNSLDGSGILSFEVVSYSPTTGAFCAYVKVPTMQTSSVIYLLYGNSSVTTDQSNTTAVWSNGFLGVYHFGVNNIYLDSVGNANITAYTSGGLTQGSPGTAGVGGQQVAFSSAAQQYAATAAISAFASAQVTMECWANVTSGFSGNNKWFFGASTPSGNNTGTIIRNFNTQVDELILAVSGITGLRSTSNLLSNTTWAYMAMSATNANPPVGAYYEAGASMTGTNPFGSTSGNIGGSGNVVLWIGNLYGLIPADDFPLNGYISEARYSSVVRSADWITASYNNQSAPASFYTVT